jgi:hypothetical protein
MKVKITMEIPVEKLTDLQALLSSESEAPVPVPEVPAVVAAPVEEKKPKPAAQKVTKTMIRARGIELTQAGKKAELNEVFRKFGAEKLSAVKEEDYEAVYEALGEL